MALSKKYADWEFQNPIKVRVNKFTLIDRFFILHQINYLCIETLYGRLSGPFST